MPRNAKSWRVERQCLLDCGNPVVCIARRSHEWLHVVSEVERHAHDRFAPATYSYIFRGSAGLCSP